MVYDSQDYHAGRYQYSLDETPNNLLVNMPNVERGRLRPDGWGSIQRQQSTMPLVEESNRDLFYAALAILALVLVYLLILAL